MGRIVIDDACSPRCFAKGIVLFDDGTDEVGKRVIVDVRQRLVWRFSQGFRVVADGLVVQ